MKIQDNTVVRFHYCLRDASTGEELENSYEGEPNTYLYGSHTIAPGLEYMLKGKEAGDAFSATLLEDEAFGVRHEGRKKRVPIKHLIGNTNPKLGDVVSVQTIDGPRKAVVIKVGKFNVDVDANHPYSGKTVTFDVEVLDVREATKEELDAWERWTSKSGHV